jgi:hypothetical protein
LKTEENSVPSRRRAVMSKLPGLAGADAWRTRKSEKLELDRGGCGWRSSAGLSGGSSLSTAMESASSELSRQAESPVALT